MEMVLVAPEVRFTGAVQLSLPGEKLALVQLTPSKEKSTLETAMLSVAVPVTEYVVLVHLAPDLRLVTLRVGAVTSAKLATSVRPDVMGNFNVVEAETTLLLPSVQFTKAEPLAALAVIE